MALSLLRDILALGVLYPDTTVLWLRRSIRVFIRASWLSSALAACAKFLGLFCSPYVTKNQDKLVARQNSGIFCEGARSDRVVLCLEFSNSRSRIFMVL